MKKLLILPWANAKEIYPHKFCFQNNMLLLQKLELLVIRHFFQSA